MKNLRFTSLTSVLGAVVIGFALMLGGCDDSSKSSKQQQQSSSSSTDASSASAGGTAAVDSLPVGEPKLTRNFYFVLDGSNSMNDCPPATAGHSDCVAKIVGAKRAIKETVDALPEDTNLGLYSFDNNGDFERVPLGGGNRAQFLAQLDAVVAGDGTPLGAAIKKGVAAIEAQKKKQLGYGEYRLVIVTDGEATDTLSKGTNAAKAALTPMYTIGFGIGPTHALRQYSVQYWGADTDKQVKEALASATSESDSFDPTEFKSK